MKPIIQELCIKATVDRPVDYLTSNGKVAFTDTERGVDLELFAELVVKECCGMMQGFTFEEIATKVMKNHFEIE